MRWIQGLAMGAVSAVFAASAQAAVTLQAEKKSYRVGQRVVAKLDNNTNQEIMWGSIGRYPTVWRNTDSR